MVDAAAQIQEPEEPRQRVVKLLITALLCLVVCAIYFQVFIKTAYVEVEISVPRKTNFEIFWAGEGQPYSERRMAGVAVYPDRKNYSFFFTDLGKVKRLRIDPHKYAGEVTLKKLVIHQEGFAPIVLSTPEELAKLVPLHDIEESHVDNNGLWLKSSDIDPNFELVVTPERQPLQLAFLITRLAILILLVIAIFSSTAPLAENLQYVPILLFGVWMLIITMAGLSASGVHPDERVHMAATAYYKDHWLPPRVEDPAIQHTFSIYGVSRLNNGEFYYLPAGKFYQFMNTFSIPDYLALRLFNVCLFGIILLYAIRNHYARIIALPMLISPQIWYLFSYCCSDGFAIFIGYLVACQLIDPGSLMHQYLKSDKWSVKIFGGLTFGLVFGMLFLLKRNYLPFMGFALLVLFVKILWTDEFYWEKKTAIIRFIIITVLGLGVFSARVAADHVVNDFHFFEKRAEVMEERAGYKYKPSTELSKKAITLYQRARGTTLRTAVIVEQFFENTFRSSFGVYGYFTISGSYFYYDLVRWLGVFLFVLFFGSIFRSGGLVGSGLALVALGLSLALLGISLYHAWTEDFQAQGRYLFPIVGLVGILYGWNYKVINQRLLLVGIIPMFILGLYSFIFEALMRIPKIVFS